MLSKIRTILPLMIVFSVVLACAGFGLSSRSLSEAEKSESQAADSAEISVSEMPDLVALKTDTAEEVSDPYAELLNSDGYYATGDSGYTLTDKERNLVERAVMCEAGGEGIRGEMMIAQSILDGALRNDYNIYQEIKAYGVALTRYGNVTDEVREAVTRVFDDGERVTMQKTDLWYNPEMVVSLWHEEQLYVTTVGKHRFFWMNNDI